LFNPRWLLAAVAVVPVRGAEAVIHHQELHPEEWPAGPGEAVQGAHERGPGNGCLLGGCDSAAGERRQQQQQQQWWQQQQQQGLDVLQVYMCLLVPGCMRHIVNEPRLSTRLLESKPRVQHSELLMLLLSMPTFLTNGAAAVAAAAAATGAG
jgi:hypothetical protein